MGRMSELDLDRQQINSFEPDTRAVTNFHTTLFLAASVAVVVGSYGSLYLLIINL